MHLIATIRDDNGQSVGVIVLAEKEFRSGKEGWFGQGKLTLGSQRFQAQAQLVGIESKPKGGAVEVEAGAEG